MRREFVADRGDDGVRLDLVLARHLADRPDLSRNRIQQLITSGQVVVDGAPRTRSASRAVGGCVVAVDLPEPPPRMRPVAEVATLEVVYEDDDLLVVNKPPGIVAHPAYRNERGTLLNALLGYLGQDAERAPRLVNRLDRDTSGLVLVARTGRVHSRLVRGSGAAAVTKHYLAIVHGRPKPPRGIIDLPLARSNADRRRVAVVAEGRRSLTEYQVLAALGGPWRGSALVRCRLLTGRTHQVRVHLAARGWPILGDRVYGLGAEAFPRQALHAWELDLEHPSTGRPMHFTAPLPPDMAAVVERGEATASLTRDGRPTSLRSPE